MTVFDAAEPGADDGDRLRRRMAYTPGYQPRSRGGGVRSPRSPRVNLTHQGTCRRISAQQYLPDAERPWTRTQHNREYCATGRDIIDDYTALLAATELYRATRKDVYLQAARRAPNYARSRRRGFVATTAADTLTRCRGRPSSSGLNSHPSPEPGRAGR